LLDGGNFIVIETTGQDETQFDTAEDDKMCSVGNWQDVFVKTNTCPVSNRRIASVKFENDGQTGDIQTDDSADVTEPLPHLPIRPLGLNVAPLPRQQHTEFPERNSLKDEVRSEEIEVEQINKSSGSEPILVDDREEVHVKEQHKPYIVKATPKDIVQTPVVKEKDVVNATEEKEPEVIEELPKNDSIELPTEGNAVEEELLNPPVETEEEKIAPFSQWAEKKLVEEALLKDASKKEIEPESESNGAPSHPVPHPNPPKTNGLKLTKNFASPDCSAKIMGANPESQGSGNVITSSRDEYFLNKCTDQAWFVVELCESIKALKIQIANFELYSSSPNQFRVSIGNVFPGREKDWMEFGSFSYQDERNIQTFKSDVGVVGKYAKVEILSHHGNEHYCPVSMFKVYGISEIDLITEDDPNDDHDDAPEETVDDELSEHIIVKTIKEAVHKVVNVFRPQNVSLVATLNTSSLQGASLRFRLRPEGGQKQDQMVVNRYHMIYYLLATQYYTVKQYTKIMKLDNLLPLVCSQYGVPVLQNNTMNAIDNKTDTCSALPMPWQFLKFVRVVHGEDFLVALCNVVSMEMGESRLVEGGRMGDKQNTTVIAAGSENKTIYDEKVAEASVPKVVSKIEKENVIQVKESPKEVVIEKETPISGLTDKVPQTEPHTITKSEPSITQQDQTAAKPSPAASSVKTGNSASVVNTVSQAGQTTWQKLSNRIKALERNVTLSTGFLEELSLKYIKQIEELNSAVKLANDAISGVVKREELARERHDQLAHQVNHLNKNLEQLTVRVGELQEEVLARHGLLLLLEVLVIGLVFLLCRPGGGRTAGRSVGNMVVDRRRSLDTIKGEREKMTTKQEKRRSSIEVGCLPNGQVGSMQGENPIIGLTKKQRKRKRRRDSRLGLRNVVEELESDESKAGVYDTFHGAEQRRMVENRKRSRSWSEQQEEVEMIPSQVILESSLTSTSASQGAVSPSRFSVDHVFEQEGELRAVEDCVFTCDRLEHAGRWGHQVDTSNTRKSQHTMYKDRRYTKRLSDISPTQPSQSTSTCYLNSRNPIFTAIPNPNYDTRPPSTLSTSAKSDNCKSVRFPGRSRKGSVLKVNNCQQLNGHDVVEVSNMYTMLEHSVHETSACETEGEEGNRDRRGIRMSNASQQKAGRSKSSSPNRQANLLMRRQREAIRKFQPDQAEWLHKKRDN